MSDNFDITAECNKLRGVVSLPPGWCIVPDIRTENLLVHDGERGFAVTAPCLKEWQTERIVDAVNAATAGKSDLPIFSLTELIAQGSRPCAFDN